MNYTKGEWFVEKADLTIRSKAWGKSDQMGDCRGIIIADLRPALGTDSDKDVNYDHLGRSHALPETLANAQLISAAPSMYEALKGILFGYESGNYKQAIAEQAKKALAKAEGKL